MLKPKLITTLQNYSWNQFRMDATAGIIVGIVALPLAIAFAIASGVSPDRGLVTAVVAGLLISALGGSRVQIGGPTGAFVVIVYGIVQRYGMDGLILATFLAGIILLVFGFARFGVIMKFIPYPVTIGFTSGIAVIIFSSQIKDFFGLQMGAVPAEFFDKWISYASVWDTVNVWAVTVSAGTIAVNVLWQRINKTIPGSLIALIFFSACVSLFHWPVETIGSRFGHIPQGLPVPVWPSMSFELFQAVIPSAFTIAILAGIESLLSAAVADGMMGGKHRSNMELIAQGAANMASALFGGMPATGAIARTATNVHNGGRTPVAGIIHALTLLLIMTVFGSWAVLIPLPCLAGILMIVAYRMSERHSFAMMLRAPKSDALVLLTTFALTILVDLTTAIEIGMVLAAFLLVRRLALSTNITAIRDEFRDEEERDDPNAISRRAVPKGVEVFEIAGPFFFGMTSTFLEVMKNIEQKPAIRILRMRHVLSIDATAMNALNQIYHFCESQNIVLLLSGVHAQPLVALERSGFLDKVGEDRIFCNIDDALNEARALLGLSPQERKGPFVPTVKREVPVS